MPPGGGQEPAAGSAEGGIRKLEAPARIAPDRRSEVAQSVFVAWWVVWRAGIGLRVSTVIDRLAVHMVPRGPEIAFGYPPGI